MATVDPSPRAALRPESSAPVVPEQRIRFDASLTQQRVDAIFRALVVRRALEQQARLTEQPGAEDRDR